jgi:hypothetical protein
MGTRRFHRSLESEPRELKILRTFDVENTNNGRGVGSPLFLSSSCRLLNGHRGGASSRPYGKAERLVVKVEAAEGLPSGAEAHRFLSAIYGTAEAVPFQNPTPTTDCQGCLSNSADEFG